MRTNRTGLTAQALLALLALTAPARAEAPTEARLRLMDQAHRAADDGRFSEARDLWLALWDLDHARVSACNIGTLAYRIGDHPDAVKWLTLCLTDDRAPVTQEERELSESRRLDLAMAKQAVGRLRIVAPPGAVVTVDGDPVDISAEVALTPGRHHVRAQRDGATAEAEVDLRRGDLRILELTLATPPSGPRPAIIAAGAGASAALLVLGAGLWVAAGNAEREGDRSLTAAGPSHCLRVLGVCRDVNSSYSTMAASRDWATASLLAGGALAAGTLGYVLSPRRAEVVVTGAGLAVLGTW